VLLFVKVSLPVAPENSVVKPGTDFRSHVPVPLTLTFPLTCAVALEHGLLQFTAVILTVPLLMNVFLNVVTSPLKMSNSPEFVVLSRVVSCPSFVSPSTPPSSVTAPLNTPGPNRVPPVFVTVPPFMFHVPPLVASSIPVFVNPPVPG